MSSCNIVGFFCLARGNRIRVNKAVRNGGARSTSAGSVGTWYTHYDTTMSCLKDTFVSADLRVYCPLNDVVFPNNSIAFVIGKIFVRTGEQRSLIDATYFHVIPGDVSSPNYQDSLPSFVNSYVYSVGTVCGEHQVLEDRSRVFPVSVSEFLREETKSFQIMCLFNADKPRWNNTNIPNVGSVIQFTGLSSRVLPLGLLAVDLNSIVFNIGSHSSPGSHIPPHQPSGVKRRKFNAYPPSFQASVPASTALSIASPFDSSLPTEGSSSSVNVSISGTEDSRDEPQENNTVTTVESIANPTPLSAKARGKQRAK